MRKLLLAGLAALFVLTGCASSGQSMLTDVSALTVPDLQSALALATAADDKPAMQCYAGLIPIVQSLPAQLPNLDIVTGQPVTDFEKARLLAKKVAGFSGSTDPLIQGVNLACGALWMDAKGDAARLLLKFRP